jgi:putative peptide zinc metalloprotease protein
MNLTRALDVALPEIPARTLSEHYPRLDPGATFREHIEDGRPMVRIYVPTVGLMYRFPYQNWRLARLFDGKRSYEEIAELFSQETGVQYDPEEIREFAAELEAGGFWYKTDLEKNILLMQQSAEERRKKLQGRRKWGDLSLIFFPAFNPDRFLTWLYNHTKFMYTTWFIVLTVVAFAVTAGISIIHWSEIGRDSLQFYNFKEKTWGDILYFYALFMIIVAVHEFAHAHACKHYGARVSAMGFALIYLTPAFYTDTTEGAVLGSRQQRLIISLAGIWSELMVCSIATPIWWGTPPDTPVHDGAYFIMMLTGIVSLIVNWNPLMKLDGYHMLCEVLGIEELKEDSTAYVSAWVKNHIWHLPVEVPYVPRRRRLGFALYALLSGAYSYMVLYIVARFAGNIVRNFSLEWGFIPEIAVGLVIFRSRIRLLVNFMKLVYLDKKERVVAWLTPQHSLALVAALAVFLGLPIRRESVSGTFFLEPTRWAVVRARIPGTVTHLDVREGQQVSAGESLATLTNLPLKSDFEHARARLLLASERANAASLHYADLGTAVKERDHLTTEFQQLSEMNSALQLSSPISGTVVTPKVGDMLGSYLNEGSALLEIANLSTLTARIYISEFDLYKIHAAAPSRLQVQGLAKIWPAEVLSIAARPSEMDPQLSGQTKLKGMNPPHFYLATLLIHNPDCVLRPGMKGVARVYGRRRSLIALGWEAFTNFIGRKLW